MRFQSLAALLCAWASVQALPNGSPYDFSLAKRNSTGLTNVVTWDRVSTDTTNFTLVLTNQVRPPVSPSRTPN